MADSQNASPTFFTSNIEVVQVTNGSSADYTLNAANMDGLTTVKVNGGISALTVENAKSILNAELAGADKGLTLTTAATKVAGEADSASVTLNAVGTSSNVTVRNNGIETLNVALTGSASGGQTAAGATTRVTLASDELEKVVVTGSVDANLAATFSGATAAAQVGTFDASAATGKINASVTAGTSTKLAVTLGSGNDVLILGSAIAKEHTLAGGAGTDVLIATSAAYSAASTTQPGANVTGFEVIGAGGGDVDLRVFNANTFSSILGSGTYTGVNAALASASLETGSLSITRATDGAADTISVDLTGKTETTYASISLADEETVTLNVGGQGASGLTHTITALTLGDTTTLNITGNRGLVVTGLTGEEALSKIDASKHTGKELNINAADSNVAMTIIGSAGAPTTTTGTVNTLTGGSKADSITGGDYADVLTGGLGADTLVGGAGNDTLTGENGNDSILGGAGNDTISAGAGDDYVDGGDGNDSIDAGTGADTVLGGAGTDNIKITLSDSTSVDGGAGTDRVANSTTTITSSSATSVDGAFIAVAESVAPKLTSVESLYVSVDTNASTTDAPVTLDLAGASSLSTLFLEVLDSDATAAREALKIKDFAGGTVKVYGATSGVTTTETNDLTVDGVGQAALNLSLEDFDQTSSGKVTFTGVQNVTITSNSTSQFTGSADQGNTLGDVTAAAAESVKIVSTGSSDATTDGTLTINSVSASAASALTIDVGARDDVDVTAGVAASGSAVEAVTITVGVDATLEIGDVATGDAAFELGTASLDTVTISLAEDAILQKAGGSGGAVEFDASRVEALSITLANGSEAELDLTGVVVTAGTVSLASSSDLFLTGALGGSTGASSFIFSGRGDLDAATNASNTFALSGTTITFDTTGLTEDADGFTITTTASTGATVRTALGADNVTGGDGNDSISTGVGDDTLAGGAGDDVLNGGLGVDLLTGGAGNDSITLTETVSSADTVVVNSTATSSDSAYVAVAAGTATKGNDAGGDTVTGFNVAADVLKVVASGVVGYDHGSATNFTVGGATTGAEGGTTGAAGEFAANTVLFSFNNASDFNDAGDVVINFSSTVNGTTAITTLAKSDISGRVAYDLTGDGDANAIVGGDLADTISGGAGADTITGGAGVDLIIGGTGADVVTGGSGNDVFDYNASDETFAGAVVSGTTALTGIDRILDAAAGDKIDVSSITGVTISDGDTNVGTTVLANATATGTALVSGAFNTSTGVFTAGARSASNNDYLVQVADGTSIISILLLDTAASITKFTSASEVLTFG